MSNQEKLENGMKELGFDRDGTWYELSVRRMGYQYAATTQREDVREEYATWKDSIVKKVVSLAESCGIVIEDWDNSAEYGTINVEIVR